jgi:hypothetical protein
MEIFDKLDLEEKRHIFDNWHHIYFDDDIILETDWEAEEWLYVKFNLQGEFINKCFSGVKLIIRDLNIIEANYLIDGEDVELTDRDLFKLHLKIEEKINDLF